jgi:hypothetical protein
MQDVCGSIIEGQLAGNVVVGVAERAERSS